MPKTQEGKVGGKIACNVGQRGISKVYETDSKGGLKGRNISRKNRRGKDKAEAGNQANRTFVGETEKKIAASPEKKKSTQHNTGKVPEDDPCISPTGKAKRELRTIRDTIESYHGVKN